MLMIFTASMENKFKIGDKVAWKRGSFICRGLYLDVVNTELTLIQCYEKDGKRCVIKVQVLNSLLNADIS